MGDKVKLSIIRNGKAMEVEVPLTKTGDDMFLVKTTRYDEMPTYAIYGGYV